MGWCSEVLGRTGMSRKALGGILAEISVVRRLWERYHGGSFGKGGGDGEMKKGWDDGGTNG